MRAFKSKGFVLSFGDIMLPMIGVVAVALLFVAGRLFFFSGSRPAIAGLPVIKETPAKEAKRVVNVTQIDQPQKRSPAQPPVAQSQPKPAASPVAALPMPSPLAAAPPENFPAQPALTPQPAATDIALAIPYKPAAQNKPITAPMTAISVTSAPAPAPKSAPAAARRSTPMPALPPARPSAAQSSPAQSSQVWMVQVGAFSTAASANALSKELSGSGYLASVVSGAKLHKVLVRGGATRASASAVAAKIGQGAFVVPPDTK